MKTTLKKWMCLLLLLPLFAGAQEPTGNWEGTLAFGDARLRIVFRIADAEQGLTATLDSPDQGMRGLSVERVSWRDSELRLEMPALQASYRGMLLPVGLIVGTFSQAGMDIPLSLTRREFRRPQEPRPPYPYACREVSFPSRSSALTLAGTLTMPAEAPRAGVVLVSGSGTQNRDEEILGHKPFLVIADFLTRRGIAVLRYDDRGFGASVEERRELAGSTTDDLAQDALGAYDFLRALPEMNSCPVGILGHSEGGTIAFIAASAEPGMGFVVSLAGLAVPGSRASLAQNRRIMERQGMPAEQIASCCELLEKCFRIIADRTPEQLAAEREELKRALAAAQPGASLPEAVRGQLLGLLDAAAESPWVYRFLTYDPAPEIVRTGDRPVLALNGSLDRQVDAEENLGALARLLGGSQRFTVKRYEGLNHLFQPCTTGDVGEYEQIETTVAPQVLEDVAAWIGSLAP